METDSIFKNAMNGGAILVLILSLFCNLNSVASNIERKLPTDILRLRPNQQFFQLILLM